MGYKGLKRFSAVAAVGACAVFATYYGWLASRHLAPVQPLIVLYQLVLLVLLATWVVADGELRRRDRPTFDQGVFVIFLFLVYVPCYLFATRRARGLLIFGGMLLLPVLPELVADIVSSFS
jgi:hypothetical protein